VLDAVNQRSKTTHALLRDAEPTAVDAKTLTLAFASAPLERMFSKNADFFGQAFRETVGIDLKVLTVCTGAGTAPAAGSAPVTAAAPEPDVVDVTESVDEEPSEAPVDPVDLLKQNLGAQVIGEIDSA
jgi:DNA polymerase-3 subunit gamma/tau